MKGNFELSRQNDFNHYTASRQMDQNHYSAAMQSERHNFETNKNVDNLRYENEKQTLLLMREMDQKEAAALREKLLFNEMARNNDAQTAAIINAIRPYPVPVNQVWGQVQIPAFPQVATPHGGGCFSGMPVV